ncbi:Coenzyme PQQ synthesis protein D (PqqD) [Ruminococcus sp. YE71]|uniref:PqqD family protein n=1 Tax=unclassified Ruminococcus TaxID=2608920 RepID=UPI0008873A5C|nr:MULTISPECIES: PqqD family protein [unclassified Ruminococcus]SDA18470.1 Coenzyme PQQ synthesis protein D (PqqD) [Ruminococcus sp. YE78]SFW29868.1 Coenzyme PQQ synthesis protein D (PqqD) [Ruminococcus sp. YE71]
MKLSNGFIAHTEDGERVLVSTGAADFSGLVRANPTAAFIIDRLIEGTTEEELVDKLCEKYDAPREVIAADAAKMIAQLREIGAVED